MTPDQARTVARLMAGACPSQESSNGEHAPLLDQWDDPVGAPLVGMHAYVCRHCRALYCHETIGEACEKLEAKDSTT